MGGEGAREGRREEVSAEQANFYVDTCHPSVRDIDESMCNSEISIFSRKRERNGRGIK